jgi:hypothetical protein
MSRKIVLFATALLTSVFTLSATAGSIPYDNIGTEAPSTAFQAQADGEIIAYFYATDAGYDSQIGMWVNGVATGIYGLWNHGSSRGDSLVLGEVKAGDIIAFELKVSNINSSWYSVSSLNSDGLNHAYSTDFAGDEYIPMGTYIGFEDKLNLGDFDYNDHQFVFTNVRKSSVPEPGSMALLGLGLIALRFARKRVAVAA